MPTRSEYNGDYDVGLAFKRIEDELIDSMMRNLARHNKEEDELGFDWTQWQTEQLESLERYRRTNARKFPRQFREINRKMDRAIRKAEKTGRNEEEINILETLRKRKELRDQAAEEGNLQNGFFSVDNSKLDALLNATQNDMQKAEYAVLRRANDQYRKIIFDAQVYYDTGAGTFEKALDMATHDFLSRGIDSIEYKNGARHTISDYADMVLKTAETRAYLTGQGQIRQEWGEHYVIVNKRGDVTCPKCAKWVGRVLIDDVYSGGQSDGKTPLLSTAMSQGFLHPRCKDIFTTYFPGISTPPDPAMKEEILEAEEIEKLEAKEQYAQRQAEKYERLSKYSLDDSDKLSSLNKAQVWSIQAQRASILVSHGVNESAQSIPQKVLRKARGMWASLFEHEPISVFDLTGGKADELNAKLSQAPSRVQNLFNRFRSELVCCNERADFFTEGKDGIRVNLARDLKNPRGALSGTFHEIGHRIDRLLGYPTHNPAFEKSIRDDFEKIVIQLGKSYNYTQDEVYEHLSRKIKGDRLHAISDLFNALSDGHVRGGYGHPPEYWKRPNILGKEAFAHFFSAYARVDIEEIYWLESAFPTAFGMFKEMLL